MRELFSLVLPLTVVAWQLSAKCDAVATDAIPSDFTFVVYLWCSGWLEPLLDRIAADKSTVVCPVIDVIEDETLRYLYGSARSTSIGGFDWGMQFTWHAIPDSERNRRTHDIDPIRFDLSTWICW